MTTNTEKNMGKPVQSAQEKPTWEPMRVQYLGDIKTIVQGGGGKLSSTAGDPGESRKQRGGE